MIEDEYGFVFPVIDTSLCVDCGICGELCEFQNGTARKTSGPWYAAAYRGDSSRSASAGAFYALALSVLSVGGAVFGAAYVREGDDLRVRHVMAEDIDSLRALQGSKYVQSDVSPCFQEVERQLGLGREVLFSGTPCQVAGLRGYLRHEWPNLITVDLVCHGVPSEQMFRSFVSSIERERGMRVVNLSFRCKRWGWGHSLLLCLLLRPFDASDSLRDETVIVSARDSAYYDLFLNLKTLRDSCYSCPFAGCARPGDITVGDFWGVDENCPIVMEDARFNVERGVSCLLINNERGRFALDRFGKDLDLLEVSLDDIVRGNDQLRQSSILPKDRLAYISTYRDYGWSAVEEMWRRRERGVRYRVRQVIKAFLPDAIIHVARRLASRV